MKAIITGVALQLFLVAIIATNADAAIFYQQGFDSPDTTGTNSTAVGVFNWAAHRGETGANGLPGAPIDWPSDPLSGGNSQMRVVDDAAAPSGTNRIFSFWNADPQEDVLLWTQDFSGIPLSAVTDLDINWSHRNSNTGSTRAAVAIDTGTSIRWFASSPLETSNNVTWTQETADLLAPVWIEFTFTGTQTGDATAFDVAGIGASLPAGTLVAGGIYLEFAGNDSIRLDSFSIEGVAVPEPSTLALLAFGALGLTALVRHRRA